MRSDVHVEFYIETKPDKKASREAGRPVHKEVEYVRIKFPGDRNRVIEQPAHTTHRLEASGGRMLTYAEGFPEHYAAFKAQNAAFVSGTPLSELPFLTEAERADLKAINIVTAEMIAEMSRPAMKKYGMNAQELVKKAKAYLEKASGFAIEAKLADENAALQAQIDAMRDELAMMQGGQTEHAEQAA